MTPEPVENPWPRRIVRFLLMGALAGVLWSAHNRMETVVLPSLQAGDDSLPVGVYHITSAASRDPSHPLKTWASIASDANLDFLVVTDLNDQLAGPVEYEGITVVSAAELDTPFGRVVQLGAEGVIDREAQSRLDLLARLRSQEGVPLISHPTDPKRPWTGPIEDAGGLEIASFSSAMRTVAGRFFIGAVPSLVASQVRPGLALSQLYVRDPKALSRWDAESDPAFVGMCGADARGLVEPGQNLKTWQIVLDAPLDDESDASDGAQLVERISEGRFYCAAGLFGLRPYFRFGALKDDSWVARPGDSVALANEIVVFGPKAEPTPALLVLLRNGEEVARLNGEELRYRDPMPGTYRAEVRVSVPRVFNQEEVRTVIYSNRIRLLSPEDDGAQ